MRKLSTLALAALLCALLTAAGVAAAAGHHAHPKARPTRLAPPHLLTPAPGLHSPQAPILTWSAVKGATEYEYQLSADPHFNSIVLGSGIGTGTAKTHNLAAALSRSIPDGAYYWRVRGITSTGKPGAWSPTRTLVKAWTEAPQLLAPADEAAVRWPSTPLVMSWAPVPDAAEYIVTIATDPALSNVVLGSATSPQKTDATVFALPGTLSAGHYYWAITPIDGEGHRGTRSSVRSFSWSWPTTTTTHVYDLNPDQRVFDPQFTWAPVPGAARYEVEVNSAADFPVGSKWCCNNVTTGTSLAPTASLANNEYFWRVRAIDASGNTGAWNIGASFTKAFDSVTPTVSNLALSDVSGTALAPGSSTDTPIVTWSAVPGAASYEVQVTRYVPEFGCNWAASGGGDKQVVETSSLAWTPLGPDGNHIGPTAWPGPRTGSQLTVGNTYCVRVLARSDSDAKGSQIVSDWTQIGGVNQPAFLFAGQPAPGLPGPGGLTTPASAYLLPGPGSSAPRTPLFTWQRVAGASLYYVVVARDAGFTHVVDVASTIVPAYAPQLDGEEPLNDETSAYYWAVVPVNAKGEVFSDPSQGQDAPQSFNKSSAPPGPSAPINVDVSDQPTFSWSAAEGALNYTLQVSEDPSFGNPLENITTDATAYTSSSTYPPNITLYWRVRANNAKGVGLNWSSVQSFRRTLPTPSAAPGNATGGEAIPVFSWSPVTGATGYQLHVEQADGSTKDFTLASTAFTPTVWYGTGIWRWQVRAQFSGGSGAAGGYLSPQAFIRTFAPPSGIVGIKAGARITIGWSPDPYAKQYEIDLSTSETFNSTLESRRIDGLTWAPDIDLSAKANRGRLFWRVAAVDAGGNLGPFNVGSFTPPRKAKAKACPAKRKHAKKPPKCAKRRHKHR